MENTAMSKNEAKVRLMELANAIIEKGSATRMAVYNDKERERYLQVLETVYKKMESLTGMNKTV